MNQQVTNRVKAIFLTHDSGHFYDLRMAVINGMIFN